MDKCLSFLRASGEGCHKSDSDNAQVRLSLPWAHIFHTMAHVIMKCRTGVSLVMYRALNS